MPENPKTGLVNRVKNATIDETSLKRKEHLDQKEMLLNVVDVEACEEVAVEVVVDPVATEEDVVELVVESNVISTGSLAMIRRELKQWTRRRAAAPTTGAHSRTK